MSLLRVLLWEDGEVWKCGVEEVEDHFQMKEHWKVLDSIEEVRGLHLQMWECQEMKDDLNLRV
jgi:hypothetical protein